MASLKLAIHTHTEALSWRGFDNAELALIHDDGRSESLRLDQTTPQIAVVVALLRWAARDRRSSDLTRPLLRGAAPSLASSLAEVLSVSPWIAQLSALHGRQKPFLRDFFESSTQRKGTRGRYYEISGRSSVLDPGSLTVTVNGRAVTDSMQLRVLSYELDETVPFDKMASREDSEGASSVFKHDVAVREGHFEHFRAALATAERVVFLGGLSQTLIDGKFVAKLLTRIQAPLKDNDRPLHCVIIMESDDQFYRRAQYIERQPVDHPARDVRPFPAILKRKDAVLEALHPALTAAASQQHHTLELFELQLQLGMAVTQIDDSYYVTPLSHRRNSQGAAILIKDPSDPMYTTVSEYVSFILNPRGGRPFCVPLDLSGGPADRRRREIVPLHDTRGVLRGLAARCSFAADVEAHPDMYAEPTKHALPAATAMVRRVVHGFVFDPDGRLILQERSENVEDNARLIDKSYGGHMAQRVRTDDSEHSSDASELTPIDTARRELAEELVEPSYRLEATAAIDCGTWSARDGIKLFRDMNAWQLFTLRRLGLWWSKRALASGRELTVPFWVDVFLVYCPNRRALIDKSHEVKRIIAIDPGDLRQFVANHRCTSDLAMIAESAMFDDLVAFGRALGERGTSTDRIRQPKNASRRRKGAD